MIKITDAGKSLRDKNVLIDINIEFEDGKAYLLTGSNGCGKTMLLRLMCGLIKPDSGQVEVPKDTTFGVIIESPAFVNFETGYENLKYLANIRGKIGRKEIEAVMERLDLTQAANKRVKTYSLGMKQRLAICQAFMEEPDVLLLDEPFNAVDSKNVETICEMIKESRDAGKIVVVAAHSLAEDISDIFDKKIVMCEGKIESVEDISQ